MRLKFSDFLRRTMIEFIQENPKISIDALCELVQGHEEVMSDLNQVNTRKIESVHRHLLLKAIRAFGFENYAEFKKTALHNHKVIAVEIVEGRQDTGCITVEKWHNFALESGVFVACFCSDPRNIKPPPRI
jgi:hypothetical protein